MRSVAFGFLTFAAMQCWASGVFGDQPASNVLELMRPFVPIELTLPLAELPPEKNAIGAAMEMAKLYEPLSRYGRELELRRDNPIEKALMALTSVNDIKEKKLLDDYVNKHQELLNAFKQFVEIGDVRVSTLSEWVPIQSALRRANRVGCVRARLLLANGQYDAAIRQYDELLKGASITQCSIEYGFSMGMSEETSVVGCMARAVIGEAVSQKHLEQMLELADRSALPTNRIDSALRSELLTDFIPIVLLLTNDNDVDASVEALLNEYRPNKAGVPFDVSGDQSKRKQMILAMLEGHHNAFSKSETIETLGSIIAEIRSNATLPWREHDWRVQREMREVVDSWPAALSLEPLSLIGFIVGQEQEAVDDSEIEASRERLLKIENPFGKYVLATRSSQQLFDAIFRYSTELQLRKTVIAIELYRRRFSRAPKSLEDLVQEGVLLAAPEDPFGTHIRYSPDEMKLWSVGENGRDEGGVRDFNSNGAFQFLRAIRPKGAPPVPDDNPVTEPLRDDIVFDMRPPAGP